MCCEMMTLVNALFYSVNLIAMPLLVLMFCEFSLCLRSRRRWAKNLYLISDWRKITFWFWPEAVISRSKHIDFVDRVLLALRRRTTSGRDRGPALVLPALRGSSAFSVRFSVLLARCAILNLVYVDADPAKWHSWFGELWRKSSRL